MRAANNMSGTVVGAGADLYSIIDAGAVGETFVLTASPAQPYRITMPLSFKSGQTLFSKSGSVIKGSRIVNGWTQESGTGYWYKDIALSDYSNPSVQSNMTGYAYKISGEVDQAQKLQDTFLDGTQLKRYMIKSNLATGGFYHDFSIGRTYLYDDPTGRVVEVSTATEAIHAYNTVTDCTLSGITFQHFASTPQMSAIYIEGNGWEIKNCDVSYNHSIGIKFAFVTGGHVHHNGQMGMGQFKSSGTLIEYNEFAYQNFIGDYYALDWESGSIKYAVSQNSIFRGNHCHHNSGVGLWADIDNVGLTFENNTIEDNESCGIRHEISFGAVIWNNTVRRNGYGATNGVWRTKDPSAAGQGDYFARTGSPFMTSGININCSGGVAGDSMATIEVYDNTVEYNQNGIFLQQRNRGTSVEYPARFYLTQNVKVHDNHVTVTARTGDQWGDNVSGLGAYEEPPAGTRRDFFYNWGNVLQNNTYYVDNVSAVRFSGSDGAAGWSRYNFSTHQSRGFDAGSICLNV